MPAPSRTKAEVKYNVTTDFPHLGLHFAAATGNVGLVKYALSHGQPVNSVLDGVLPLHAACSGGSDLVVRLLIENGADVNAPRLPRRYFNDKHRDASAPIVGTSGSTPLHFAAANGHTAVVSTLLLHGAHAHLPDKHGVTPEMLARQNGWLECADLLRHWELNKDKDLREREAALGEQPPRGTPNSYDPVENLPRKRIHVKRSIDNALCLFRSDSRLKPPDSTSPPASLRSPTEHPSYVSNPLGEYTFYPVDSDSTPAVSEKRPSLPHIYNALPRVSPISRSPPSPRRPRSAGTDAEPAAPPASPPRKLATKYSLLHLFRKTQPTGDVSTTTDNSNVSSERPAATTSPPASTSSAFPVSPLASSAESKVLNLSPRVVPIPSPLGHKDLDGTDGSEVPTRRTGFAITARTTTTRQQHPRGRSTSATSTPAMHEGDVGTLAGDARNSNRSLPLPHNRSASHGVKSALGFDSTSSISGNVRLRHDSNRTTSPEVRELNGCNSVTSLTRSDSGGGVHSPRRKVLDPPPAGTFDFQDVYSEAGGGEDDEEEYGIPIESSRSPFGLRGLGSPRLMELRSGGHRSAASSTSSLEQQGSTPDIEVDTFIGSTRAPPQISEFPFSINHPPPDPDGRNRSLAIQPDRVPTPSLSPSPAPLPLSVHASVPPSDVVSDSRMRGDSVSNTSADGSQMSRLSPSGTTATSDSSVTTPGIAPLGMSHLSAPNQSTGSGDFLSKSVGPLGVMENAVGDIAEEFSLNGDGTSRTKVSNDRSLSFGERRAHTPLDIDIRSISSHAQAEALVQRAQRSILEMEDCDLSTYFHHDDDEQKTLSSGLITAGWTPLSAKLAAYGQSLAIERKLKEEEEAKRSLGFDDSRNEDVGAGEDAGDGEESAEHRDLQRAGNSENGVTQTTKPRKAGLDQQFSLERKSSGGSHSRSQTPKRPSTSCGTNTDSSPNPHTPEQLQSRSASTTGGLTTTSRVSSPLKLPVSLPPTQDSISDDECAQHIVYLQTPDTLRDAIATADSDNSHDSILPSRVSTVPSDSISGRAQKDQARDVASANKLTRMGFAPSGNGRHGVTAHSPSPRAFEGSKTRFGGFKTLMQTLKGKS